MSLILPIPLAVKPVAPPVAEAVYVSPVKLAGNGSVIAAPGYAARSRIADHDRINQRLAGNHVARSGNDARTAGVVHLGDRQVDQIVDVGCVLGRADRWSDGGRIAQRAGGRWIDRARHHVGDRATRGQVDNVVDIARTTRSETRGSARGRRGKRVAGEVRRERIGDRCAVHEARTRVADDDRVDQRLAGRHVAGRRNDAGPARIVDLSDGQIRQIVDVGRILGRADGRSDGGCVGQRAGGRRIDSSRHNIGNRAARRQVDNVVDIARTTRSETSGSAGGRCGKRVASEICRERIGDRGAVHEAQT